MTATTLVLSMVALNAALICVVLLRRFVKKYIFAYKDSLRFHWASRIDHYLQQNQVSADALPIRHSWDRAAAEAVLLVRMEHADERQAGILKQLFFQWGLFDWRERHLAGGRRKWKQAEAALALSRMGCHEVLPLLLRMLDEGSISTQLIAVNTLALLGNPAALDGLMGFLEKGGVRYSRPVCCALVRCARSGPAELVRHLKNENPSIQIVVAAALAEVATAAEVSPLSEASFSPEPDVRACVARALGRTASPGAFLPLERMLGDPVWYVRLQAVQALSKTGHADAFEQVVRATQDHDWRVRGKAAAASYKMGGDAPALLKRLSQQGDRYALDALVHALERQGATWAAIESLCAADRNQREKSLALLQVLCGLGKVTPILYALKNHPDQQLRQELSRLAPSQAANSSAVDTSRGGEPGQQ